MATETFGQGKGFHSDPVEQLNGMWGFWDESWATWHGPYADETDARAALREYCALLNGPPKKANGQRPLREG